MATVIFPNKPSNKIIEEVTAPDKPIEEVTAPDKPKEPSSVVIDDPKIKTDKSVASSETLNVKEWIGLMSIGTVLIFIGFVFGWFLSSYDGDNYKYKLTQSLSQLEVEKKQTSNALKKNIEIQNEFQGKIASLSSEFINLKNVYESNLLKKDDEIKLIKKNLPTNFVVNTITNIVTNSVTNKIPSQIEKFKIDLMKKVESIDISYKKESEVDDVDIDRMQRLEKNKAIINGVILDVDKFKDKNYKEVNVFIESKIKLLNSKGIGYGTNKPSIKLK